MSLIMKVAVPVPLDALSAQNQKPYLREARKVGLKRVLEGLAMGYRRANQEVRHQFLSRQEYEQALDSAMAPALMPEVDAVVVFEVDVVQR